MILKDYLQCLKLENTLIIASGILLGMVLAKNSLLIPLDKFIFLYLMLGVGSSGGAQAFNRIFDIEIDKIEHPQRPLVKGKLKKKQVLFLSLFLLALPFSLYFLNFKIFLFSLLGIILGVTYSLPFLEFGKKWQTSYLWVALGYIFIPIVAGWLIFKDLNFFILKIAGFFTLISLFLAPIRDCSETRGDKIGGKESLPIKIGEKETVVLSLVLSFSFFLVSLGLFLFNSFLNYGLIVLSFSFFLILYMYKNPKDKINSTILKGLGVFSQTLLIIYWLL